MTSKIQTLRNAFIIICFSVTVVSIYYTNTQVLLYADDYLYGTFLRNGLTEFFKLNVWHYEFYNGRVFIHVLAQITLFFDTWLFPVVNLCFLICICFFSSKLQSGEKKYNINLLAYAAFFLSTVMLLDIKMLRESLLWISGALTIF